MKTVIEMARALALEDSGCRYGFSLEKLEAFESLIRADEREACAKVAEDTNRMVLALLNVTSQPEHIAATIRARSNT